MERLAHAQRAYAITYAILNSKDNLRFKVRLHTAINLADFVSWCMLYTYDGNKMHS